MSFKIAAIGDRDTAVGLSLAGTSYIHIHTAKDSTLARLNEFLTNKEIGIVLITHRVVDELGLEFSLLIHRKRLLPLVLRIPDKTGYAPKVDELREIIRRTVGAEVIVKGEGE